MASPNSKAKQVTPVADWKEIGKRRQLGEIIELPSGLVVKVGTPHISDLIELGLIPGELVNEAMGVSDGNMKDDSPEEKRKIISLISYIAAASLIEPKCVTDREPDYDKGEIHIRDLNDNDRLKIFSHSQSEARKYKKFRNDNDGGSDQPSGENISREQAKPDSGSK